METADNQTERTPSGNTEARLEGWKKIAAYEKEAKAKHFNLIANQAAHLLQGK